jgi:hypothetical protein
MTGQRQLESTTQTSAFNRGDKRFSGSAHDVKDLMSSHDQLLNLLERTSLLGIVHLLEIGSRAEISLLHADEDDADDGGRLLDISHGSHD